jgi:hypothetical protein
MIAWARAEHGGALTPYDTWRIRRAEDHLSRKIYVYKHNRERRVWRKG